MKLSLFGEKYTRQSGIVDLMDDLGNATVINPNMISMGGGNPGRIPEVEQLFRQHLLSMLDDKEAFFALAGRYQAPQGEQPLLKKIAEFLNAEYGWGLTEKNIAITNGGQAAFFILANMFAGTCSDGVHRKIQFPLVPEYLGYADSGLEANFFLATRPSIDILEDHLFKYRVNFNVLTVGNETAALCVSRPTNPTGNVLTDKEILELDRLARKADVPLIIDGAYGTPFPHIIFTEATPFWNTNTILMLSLSKLGLPGLRSGLLVANEEIIRAFSSANAILNLASGNVGPYLLEHLLKDKEILRVSQQMIMPWYRDKAMQTIEWFREALDDDIPYYIHKPEGAIFLWLWFEDLPIDTQELYERLKKKGVLIIPGHNSFPGMNADWRHMRECIRISYAQDEAEVKQGVKIIASEIHRLYK